MLPDACWAARAHRLRAPATTQAGETALPQPGGHPGPLLQLQPLRGPHRFGIHRAATAQQGLAEIGRPGPDAEALVLREPRDQIVRFHRARRPARDGQQERNVITGPQPRRDLAHARPGYVVQRHVLAQFEPVRPDLLPGRQRLHRLDRGADHTPEGLHLRVRLQPERARDGSQRGGQCLPVPVAVTHHGVEQPFQRLHAGVTAFCQHGRDLVGERTQ